MIPASIRNCNPGAIYPGDSAKRYGMTGVEQLMGGKFKIATFSTNEDGAAAVFDLMSRGYLDRTLSDAITKWCGALYVREYLAGIESRTGLVAGVWIDAAFVRDPARVIPLARAMAQHEAGQPFPLEQAGWETALARAVPNMPAPAVAAKSAPTKVAAPAEDKWTPDNAVPSPRPESRSEDMDDSRKWTIANLWSQGLGMLGVSAAGSGVAAESGVTSTTLSLVKTIVSNHVVTMLIVGVVVGLFVSETIKYLTKQAVIDGRYTPSGDK